MIAFKGSPYKSMEASVVNSVLTKLLVSNSCIDGCSLLYFFLSFSLSLSLSFMLQYSTILPAIGKKEVASDQLHSYQRQRHIFKQRTRTKKRISSNLFYLLVGYSEVACMFFQAPTLMPFSFFYFFSFVFVSYVYQPQRTNSKIYFLHFASIQGDV